VITLDHINIRATDIEAVRDFLVDLVDLVDGPRPEFDFPGYWLYLGDRPVVHLAPFDGNPDGGWVDHVAFAGFEFAATRERLDRKGYTYGVGGIPGGPRQLFVFGPEGLKIEMQCSG
jgi:catechol 2,3-dioxygenase-like lactoylglutathione lyase family enzyme